MPEFAVIYSILASVEYSRALVKVLAASTRLRTGAPSTLDFVVAWSLNTYLKHNSSGRLAFLAVPYLRRGNRLVTSLGLALMIQPKVR